MAKIDIGVQDVRGLLQVGPTIDQKGNPVAVVELLGVPILYANPRDLPSRDWETLEEMVGSQLGAFFAEFLLGTGVMDQWQRASTTGREVMRLSDREDYGDVDY
jgi:hypothetical protein